MFTLPRPISIFRLDFHSQWHKLPAQMFVKRTFVRCRTSNPMEEFVKSANLWLIGLAAVVMFEASQTALSQGGVQGHSSQIKGLPASDVLGSEDLWDNPTFVGGVIDGGPAASSEY
jgi:hypothetical protein